ncbi:hypothetical protein [Nocardia sp. NPDC050406]|uniref:hypothetical protein n=1 Tax=Nocardia sp. NPDC050406 TaxID=3364318 RepID=UPI0037BB73E9
MACRSIVLVAALLAAFLIAACDEPSGRGENDPPAARDSDILVAVDDSAIVLNGDRAGESRVPFFELRRDGTVFTTVKATAQQSEFGVYSAKLTGEGIEQVRAWFSDIAFNDASYPELNVTDLPITFVYANFDAPVGVSVYGVDLRSSQPSGTGERRTLSEVIHRLRTLPDDERLTTQRRAPYTPTALDIDLAPATPEQDKELDSPAAWPLDTPLTQRRLGGGGYSPLCVTIDGAEAATLVGLRTGNDLYRQSHWSTGAAPGSGLPTSVFVTVHPLLRGRTGCSTAAPHPEAPHRLIARPLHEVELADPAAWNRRYPAERLTTASGLEVYAAVAILIRGLHTGSVAGQANGSRDGTELHAPTGSALSWYEFRFVAAEVDGLRHIDLEATYEAISPTSTQPMTWFARIDLTAETVTALDLT